MNVPKNSEVRNRSVFRTNKLKSTKELENSDSGCPRVDSSKTKIN